MLGRRAKFGTTGIGLGLLAAACGGSASDGETDGELGPEAPIAIAPRTPRDTTGPAPANEPAAIDAATTRDGLPSEVASLVNDPPEAIDTEQFDALLDYYCGDCHRTPACAAACDGTWFDDWEHLTGGNDYGPGNSRLLTRLVNTLSNERMPPTGSLLARAMPDAPRQLMIEFIERAQNGVP